MTSQEQIKFDFHQIINSTQYDYFLSLGFKDFDNLNTTKQIKKFIHCLHINLFGRKYKSHNKFLQLTIVQEKHKSSNPHFHILIKTTPHNFTFDDLIKAVIYAINHCKTIRHINNKEVDYLTKNHYKNSQKSNADIIKQASLKKPHFPYNIVPIDSPQDQSKIIKYILKEFSLYSVPVAINEPVREGYYNFTFDGNTLNQQYIYQEPQQEPPQELPQKNITKDDIDLNEDDCDLEEYFRRLLL